MRNNSSKPKKYFNEPCYYSSFVRQIVTHAVFSTFTKEEKALLGTIEKFDSLLEANVYMLLKIFEETVNNESSCLKVFITRQFPIVVKPATDRFPSVIYLADFRIDLVGTEEPRLTMTSFIEAKGVETAEYRLKMKMLEHESPAIFNSILQVTSGNKSKSIVPSVPIRKLPNACIDMLEAFFHMNSASDLIEELISHVETDAYIQAANNN
jgi:hypothetical protein